MTTPPIANLADIALETRGNGEGFVARVAAIAEYPDSGKRLMLAGSPPGRRPYPLYVVAPNAAAADYYDGEE